MKILAIRGENLASLAGPFEVALERAPLADSGLFVISGATGSGKSTLLDALCLALFDKVPRLPEGYGVVVGQSDEDLAQQVKSNDVRSILRRGCAAGYAEVDFSGIDRCRYRARWEVRRARNKVQGKIQAQVLTLLSLDDEQFIARTKKQVLNAIVERLGLNFEQFRRSVLLAQGDFAAFLKADNNDRSSLLERITGTEVYSKLSIAAFNGAKQQEQELAHLKAQLGDSLPLTSDERLALQEQNKALQVKVEQLKQQLSLLSQFVHWYDRLKDMEKACHESLVKKQEIENELSSVQPRVDRLKRIDFAQTLRSSHTAMTELRQVVIKNREILVHEQLQKDQLTSNIRTLQHQTQQHQTLIAQLESDLNKAKPYLAQMRVLEVKINAQQSELSQREQNLKKFSEQLADFQRQQKNKAAKLSEQQRQQDLTQAWLAQNSQIKPVADQWSRWQADINRYHKFMLIKRDAGPEFVQLERRIAQLKQQIEQQQQDYQQAKVNLQAKHRELERHKEKMSGISLLQLQQQRQQYELQQSDFQNSVQICQSVIQLTEQLSQLEKLRAAMQAKLDENELAFVELQQALQSCQERLNEAQYAYELGFAARTQHAEQLRHLLKNGEPCPVCGSQQHPWAHLQTGLDQQLSQLKQRLTEHEQQKNTLIEKQSAMQTAKQFNQQQLNENCQQQEKITCTMSQARETWQGLMNEKCELFSQLSGSLGSEPLLQELEQRLNHNAALLDQILIKEQQGLQLKDRLESLRIELDKVNTQTHQLEHNILQMQNRSQRYQMTADELQTKLKSADEELKDVISTLSQPFEWLTNWQLRLEQNPQQFTHEVNNQVEQWHRQTELSQHHDNQLRELTLQQQELKSQYYFIEQQAAEIKQQKSGIAATIKQMLDEASKIRELNHWDQDETADVIEKHLNDNLEERKQAVLHLEEQLKQGQLTLASLSESIKHNEQLLRDQSAEFERMHGDLNHVLEHNHLPWNEFVQLLDIEQHTIEREKIALQTLKDESLRIDSIFTEREQQLQKHQDHKKPLSEKLATFFPEDDTQDLDIELVQQKIQSLEQKQNTTSELWTQKAAELKHDDDKRVKSKRLAEDIAQQQKGFDLWSMMRELIGSADGKKFRIFVQSLTLDMLLSYANQHLSDLSRRYKLERVFASDLELQIVDLEMGDEVRSVYSLSGGESFLVSLSLALGLASISSDKTQVESLFIDEGFGSLDQQTLETALASLDTLQSMGRKIGVISHIPLLVERIGVQVRVEKKPGGASQVRVISG